MLTVNSLEKSYAGRTLFSDVTFTLMPGDRAGLVGANGAGKSTLFAILLKETSPDEGSVQWTRGATVGFLPQESAPPGNDTVLGLTLAHLPEHARWEHEPKAKTILRGLAFRETDFDREAKTLSGGWIMRAHLARLLVQEPDLLLLDEPTNHLDLESLLWFQEYLMGYPGAILMISHDREFLSTICGSILEIARSKLTRYTGNYEDYLRQKADREAQLDAAYANQQREIAKLQLFVDRFKAKASKAASAQSKMKMIDKLDVLDAPEAKEKTVAFRFPQPPRSGMRVMNLKKLQFGYNPDTPIYEDLDLEVERDQRTVLVGPNGAGKSTLLKLLAGVLTAQAGERILGHNVRVGYFAQQRMETMSPNRTVLATAMDIPQPVPEIAARSLLGAFLFRGDDVFKPVGILSGGEKSRLALVRLLLDPPNFLLMDEPTTHLDMSSIDALIGALDQYQGTLVFISHDVHFIRSIAKTVLHIDSGIVTPYAGDYQYFLDKTRAASARTALTATLSNRRPDDVAYTAPKASAGKSREERKAETNARIAANKQRRDLTGRIQSIEAELSTKEHRRADVLALLQDPAVWAEAAKAMALQAEHDALDQKIQDLTTEWDAKALALEQLGPAPTT